MHPLVRHALAMPPKEAATKALRFAVRATRSHVMTRRMAGHCTYPDEPPQCPERRLGALDLAATDLTPATDALGALVTRFRTHHFNLLGSGWVRNAHGMACEGFGAHRYPPGASLPESAWRKAVVQSLNAGNRVRALGILEMIDDPAYRPIDWQIDFKSGFRWSAAGWGPATPYGHKPGIDIKVPWELARLQHLPQLALARIAAGDATLSAEFRNQVLDFWGANPPGFGVNWACAMDVAIRAANIALAWDLFRAAGDTFDTAFEAELVALLTAHGRFIVEHLEWHPSERANHYLANVAGLAFIAAYLPRSDESDLWLGFAAPSLMAEVLWQFDEDGAHFEASVAYHRLSAEMAIYATALIAGLPAERLDEATRAKTTDWHGAAPWPDPASLNKTTWRRVLCLLDGAARFAHDCILPSGRFVQIGDNDSGRFFKLTPVVAAGPAGLVEQHLDMRPLIAAASGLQPEATFTTPAPSGFAAERAVVVALAGTAHNPHPQPATRSASGRPDRHTPRATAITDAAAFVPEDQQPATRIDRVRIAPSETPVLENLQAIAWPGFGLYAWRNERTFVSIFCGPIGQHGRGGHAHNDALTVEIEIDGQAFARDPGSFIYTADLAARDRWRSVMAHFAPRHDNTEPARLLAPFRLEDRARPRMLSFGNDGCVGVHTGFGYPVYRRVLLTADAIIIEDRHGGWLESPATIIRAETIRTPEELACFWPLAVPFSPGYGIVEAETERTS